MDYVSSLDDDELEDQRLNRPPLRYLVCEGCYRGLTRGRYLSVIKHVVLEGRGENYQAIGLLRKACWIVL